MFTDVSGSFYKCKLCSFQRYKLYIYSVQSENAFTEKGADGPKEEFRDLEELPSLYTGL